MSHALPPLTFRQKREFHEAVSARVNAYLAASDRPWRDVPAYYLKAAILWTWVGASYVLLFFVQTEPWQAVGLASSLALGLTALAFNIFHDAGHDAISRNRVVNRSAALLMDAAGASSYVWRQRHNVIHHSFPNIHEYDCDIDIGTLGRLSPHQPFRPVHRFQHVYLWVLYGIYAFKWQLYDDLKFFLTGRIGTFEVARPKKEVAAFITGKAAFLCLSFLLPLTRNSFAFVLVVYLYVTFIEGILFIIVVQLSHLGEETAKPRPASGPDNRSLDVEWAVHQVQSSCDFAPKNAWLSWFLGGLNFQIEHHLFPRISHVHYVGIAPIVEATCREYGISYNSHPTVAAGLRSHYRQLRQLAHSGAGQPDGSPAINLAP